MKIVINHSFLIAALAFFSHEVSLAPNGWGKMEKKDKGVLRGGFVYTRKAKEEEEEEDGCASAKEKENSSGAR